MKSISKIMKDAFENAVLEDDSIGEGHKEIIRVSQAVDKITDKLRYELYIPMLQAYDPDDPDCRKKARETLGFLKTLEHDIGLYLQVPITEPKEGE